jgi:hypothetical protein
MGVGDLVQAGDAVIDAYPLSWPAGWPRTPDADRIRPKFHLTESVKSSLSDNYYRQKREITVASALDRLRKELARFGVEDGSVIISTNIELRRDGLPYSNRRDPGDPGVAVYWKNPETREQQAIAIDLYDSVAGNLAAVSATLDAMRAIERHGGAQILKRAFQGFKALPGAGNSTPTMDVQTASVVLSNYYPTLTPELVRRDKAALATAVRFARAKVHPDVNGGDVKAWENVETARKVLEAHHGGARP